LEVFHKGEGIIGATENGVIFRYDPRYKWSLSEDTWERHGHHGRVVKMAIHASTVYTVGQDGILVATSATSGKERWRMLQHRGAINDLYVEHASGMICTVGEDGVIRGTNHVQIEIEGEGPSLVVPAWTIETGGPCGSVHLGNNCYVSRESGEVIAYCPTSKEKLWSSFLPCIEAPKLAKVGEQVIAFGSGGISAIQYSDGTVIWNREYMDTLSIHQHGLSLYAGTRHGSVTSLDLATGAIKWRSENRSTAIFDTLRVDGRMACMRRIDGTAAICDNTIDHPTVSDRLLLTYLPGSDSIRNPKLDPDDAQNQYRDAIASVHQVVEVAWALGEGYVTYSGRSTGVVVSSKVGTDGINTMIWSTESAGTPVTAIRGSESTTELFVGWRNGDFAALNVKDGKEKWRVRGKGSGAGITGIELGQGEVYVSRRNGKVEVFGPKNGSFLRALNTKHEEENAVVLCIHIKRPYIATSDSNGVVYLTQTVNHISEPYTVGTWCAQRGLFKIILEDELGLNLVGPKIGHLVWADSTRLRLSDGLTGEEKWHSEGHMGHISALDANSSYVVSGDSMGAIIVSRTEDGIPLHHIPRHS